MHAPQVDCKLWSQSVVGSIWFDPTDGICPLSSGEYLLCQAFGFTLACSVVHRLCALLTPPFSRKDKH